MSLQDAFNNLTPIMLFVICILPMVATPIGFGIALLVRRLMPIVNILSTTIVAAYVVCVVILFVVLRRLFADNALNLYGAAVTSLIVAAGVVFVLVYAIRRKLVADESALRTAQQEEQAFAVFGEDVRARRKKLRRKP